MSETSVAIIIAVSEYKRLQPLPGCKNDGNLIRDILQQTGRFAPENIYYADTKTDSGTIKGDLAQFVKKLTEKQAAIKEVFFYYSGHGGCIGADFYYLLSDYEENKLKQTTLNNDELDGMLREVSPELAVKVVDACQSGTHYVKSSEDIERAIRKSSDGHFKKCYFMFSSEQHQSSWQDDRLSEFTRAFACSLLEHKGHPVRYQDIISYIADRFAKNPDQNPIFVTQAGFTDVFAECGPALVQLLESKAALLSDRVVGDQAVLSSTTTSTATTPEPGMSLSERLRQKIMDEAARQCTEKEANAVFEELRKEMEGWSYPELLSQFFTVKATFMKDRYEVPSPIQIAKWLEPRSEEYFVDLMYERERYENPLGLSFLGGYHNVLKGFDTSVKQPPYRSIHLNATPMPQYLNLPQWTCYVALVISRVEMRGFYTFVKYIEHNWQERKSIGKVEWKTAGFPLKERDKIRPFVQQVICEFVKVVENDLLDRYGMSES